jgi:hypothetical protein
MSEEPIQEEGGIVEGFGKGAPIPTIPPTLSIPSRIVPVAVFYVSLEQLKVIANNAQAASEHLGFSTFALGVLLSVTLTLVAGDELYAKHPIWFSFFLLLAVTASMWGLSQFFSWLRVRKLAAQTIAKIENTQSL